MAQDKNSAPVSSGWVVNRAGYEYTKSGPLISNILNWLRDKGIFVTLRHEQYQSCGTVIIEVNHEEIVIDKPKDWQPPHSKIRVIFRNQSKLLSYFSSELRASSQNSLYFKIPDELFLIQRRQHFRITLPKGSMATFLYNRKKCKLNVQDLSTGGMLLSSTAPQHLPPLHQTIKNIIITIPANDAATGAGKGILHFKIQDGEIVRSFAGKKRRLFFAGVKLSQSRKEEERIMRYIRQMELVQLRKGIQYI